MTDQAKKPLHPVAQLRVDLKSALPTLGLKVSDQERMQSVLMIAVERDPELVNADRQSLISAVRQCANHGLVPDGNEATLQVYKTKIKGPDGEEHWIRKVQYQPMVRGIINRVHRSGKVLSFWSEVVYAGEAFRIDTSDGERKPIHEVKNHFQRGADKDIVGAYSVAKLANGSIDCEPMPLSEIQKVRNVAKTKKVWDGWFSEKARVAVMRRHAKRLPLAAEDLDMILNRQEHDFDQQEMRDVTPEPDGPTLAQRIAAQEGEPKAVDGGVVAEGQKSHWTEEIDTSDAFPGDELYGDGAAAAKAGRARTECPHTDAVMAAQWLGGWDEANKGRRE